MKGEVAKAQESPYEHFVNGRDENNLCEFPLALLSDASNSQQKTIEFEDTIQDWDTGRTVCRKVCVTGSDKFGLPTAKDEEVLLALIQITKATNNFTCPEVWFVKRDVLSILGWKNRGWAYDRVEESLHRWKDVSVHYWNAWRDNANGCWKNSAAIGIIDYFSISDGRLSTRREGEDVGKSRFCWNKLFFESFQSGYLKSLDFEVYRNLTRPAAKRAYRFLDKRFWHKSTWEFDLREFACQKLGFSKVYTTGQLKEKVEPALGELEGIGFIKPVSFRKERPKVWTVAVEKKEKNAEEMPVDVSCRDLFEELISRGVSKNRAISIVKTYEEKMIRKKLEVFDWLVSRRDKRISKNRGGFLVAAIENNYLAPIEFEEAKRKEALGTQKRDNRERRTKEFSQRWDHKAWLSEQNELDLLAKEELALSSGFGSELERKLIANEKATGKRIIDSGSIRTEYVRKFIEFEKSAA